MVRHQILKERKFKQKDVLDRRSSTNDDPKLGFNFIFHPAFSKVKKTLNKIHLLLTRGKEHQKVFAQTPIVRFRRGKRRKDFLVRAKFL